MSLVYTHGIVPLKYIPSVNSMYTIDHHLTEDSILLRKEILSNISIGPNKDDIIEDRVPLQVTLGYYVAGNVGKRDVDNMNKHIIDSLAAYYKFNDNRIYDLYSYKREVKGAPSCFVYYKICKHDKPRSELSIQWDELKDRFTRIQSESGN